MPRRLVWAITGAGDLLEECFDQMTVIKDQGEWEITAVLSKAAITVLKFYKMNDRLEEIAQRVMKEKDANTPFIVAGLQTKKYHAVLAAPLTANSTAKIVLGISDTLVTNLVAQANKAAVPIYTLPVDQKPGMITTIMPSGGELNLTMRPVDLKNAESLGRMPGIRVLNSPEQIPLVLNLQGNAQKGESRVK